MQALFRGFPSCIQVSSSQSHMAMTLLNFLASKARRTQHTAACKRSTALHRLNDYIASIKRDCERNKQPRNPSFQKIANLTTDLSKKDIAAYIHTLASELDAAGRRALLLKIWQSSSADRAPAEDMQRKWCDWIRPVSPGFVSGLRRDEVAEALRQILEDWGRFVRKAGNEKWTFKAVENGRREKGWWWRWWK